MTSLSSDEARAEEVERLASGLSGDDRDFFLRVWSGDPDTYRARIRAAGFAGLGDVLDAGCGFGQWTLPLAEMNRKVTAIDVSDTRVRAVRKVAARLGADNLAVANCGVESTPYEDGSFDGIFSYSVLYLTDYRKTLAEFARLLRPQGLLYLCSNGLGWYLHNMIDGHNSTATFDSRAMAIETLQNSLDFYSGGERDPARQIVTPSAAVREQLEQEGFTILAQGPEGSCALAGAPLGPSFYQGEYFGVEGVYELIARKVG